MAGEPMQHNSIRARVLQSKITKPTFDADPTALTNFYCAVQRQQVYVANLQRASLAGECEGGLFQLKSQSQLGPV